MKVSLRTALVVLVVASIVPFGLLLHVTWWRTATSVSRDLLEVLEIQITDAARRAWWGRVAEVQGLSRTLREALPAAGDSDSQERILVAAAVSSPALSWLVYVPRQGDVLAVEEMSPQHTRVFRTDRTGAVVRSSERSGAGAPEAPRALALRGERWLEDSPAWDEPGWIETGEPSGTGRAIAYVDATGGSVLAAMIGYDRFAELLGAIPVGRTGRSYVLAPTGAILIAADAPSAPRNAAIDPVAEAAGRRVAARSEQGRDISESARIIVDGAAYAVGLSPLWYEGWQLAVIVPEAEFLGAIDATIQRVAAGMALFVIIASVIGIILARQMLAVPIARVIEDLGLIERFELERVPRRLSRLREIDRLSEAIGRMSAGLADFAKFIPTDLVRSLLSDGVRAEPGGSRRELTVLFADLAGFTGLSERLGDAIVPVVGGYLDCASRAIAAEHGTVDKFIGDAVMAFWGAPRDDPEQAIRACRAALAIRDAVDNLALPDGAPPLHVRIGLHSGPAIVGNIGSPSRLNYTALGDTVNLASRLEGVNKLFGTTIIISAAVRDAAGARIVVRELDTVAVYGRLEGICIFELIGLAPAKPPFWIAGYEDALALYRKGQFSAALRALAPVEAQVPSDVPTGRLKEVCERVLRESPGPDWVPVSTLEFK